MMCRLQATPSGKVVANRWLRSSAKWLLVLISVVGVRLTAQDTGVVRAPERADLVRGTVRHDSGQAIAGADVAITRGPDRFSIRVTTAADGSYAARFRPGTGDYLVHVAAVGYRTSRRRVTSVDSVVTADFALTRVVVALAAVRIVEAAPRPERGPEFGSLAQPGGGEHLVDGVAGALAPDAMSDLTLRSALTAGVTAMPSGAAAFGLPGAQSSITLNGMSFPGTTMPRDAHVRVRVSGSAFDPSRGGFSAVQTEIELAPGDVPSRREGHLAFETAASGTLDPIAAHSGVRGTTVRLSAGGDGEWVEDRWAYNGAIDVMRRIAPIASVFSAPAGTLDAAGLSAASVDRFGSLLRDIDAPVNAADPLQQERRQVTAIGRIDFSPRAQRTWNVTGYLQAARGTGLRVNPLSAPGVGGARDEAIVSVHGTHSIYPAGGGVLNETRTAFSLTNVNGKATLEVPDAQVSVLSVTDDQTTQRAELLFGGTGSATSRKATWGWEFANSTQWLTTGSTHRIKLAVESRLGGTRASSDALNLGVYRYGSLDDLAKNTPASYTRILSSAPGQGYQWDGAVSIGDYWNPTPALQFLYGARLEANRFLDAPERNADLERKLGLRTDQSPSSVRVSPRLGVTWAYTGRPPAGGMTGSQLGAWFNRPRGVIRAGIGEFRSRLSPGLLTEAVVSTGLPGAAYRLDCVGADVPMPDWRAITANSDAIPRACANTSSDRGLPAPIVSSYGSDYSPPSSWRAVAGWSGAVGSVDLSVDGAISLHRDQSSVLDMNLRDDAAFLLSTEGDRPIYAPAAKIVPASGAIPPLATRRDASYSQVISHRSDVTGQSRQVTIIATPQRATGSRAYANIAYTLRGSRMQIRGFDATAFRSTNLLELSPVEYESRHEWQTQLGYQIGENISMSGYVRLSSGLPFTPVVAQDINGDGLANDRAFIFDPAVEKDTLVAGPLRALMSGGSSASECLVRSVGRAVEHGECRGPWLVASNARINWRTAVPLTKRQVDIALNVVNPLAGLDALLHGTTNVHGWGQDRSPDPVLYSVRAFDPNARRFEYNVNPRFGMPNAGRGGSRAPFMLALDIRADLGTPAAVQQIRRVLDPGRRSKSEARLLGEAIKARYARTVPNLYQVVLAETDSLFLSPEQAAALREAELPYAVALDAVWSELASYLVQQGNDYDLSATLARAEAATDKAWDLSQAQTPVLQRILAPGQIRVAPPLVRMVLEARGRIKMRYLMNSS